MSIIKRCTMMLCFTLVSASIFAEGVNGMSFNGAGGLFNIPSAKVGGRSSQTLGVDTGYHMLSVDGENTHIPKAAVSFLRLIEVSGVFDIQGETRGTDLITGAKFSLPLTSTAIALGGNYQVITRHERFSAGQVYAALTYSGQLFQIPASATVVMGKTFHEHYANSNIDFGIGIDLILFPAVLESLLHWVTDFANFSYSVQPFAIDAAARGVINTGIRLDLSAVSIFSRFKFVVDLIFTDAFDHNRGFSAGVVFGVPLL